MRKAKKISKRGRRASMHLSSSHTNLVLLDKDSETSVEDEEVVCEASAESPERRREQAPISNCVVYIDPILILIMRERETIDFRSVAADSRLETMKVRLDRLVESGEAEWNQLFGTTSEQLGVDSTHQLFGKLGGWRSMVLKLHQVLADVLFTEGGLTASGSITATNVWETTSLVTYLTEMQANPTRVNTEVTRLQNESKYFPSLEVRLEKKSARRVNLQDSVIFGVDIQMLWFAVQCCGRFDLHMTAALAVQLLETEIPEIPGSPKNKLWAGPLAESMGLEATRLFNSAQYQHRLFEQQYEWYIMMLSQRGSTAGVESTLNDICVDLRYSNHNLFDEASRRRLEKLLVLMLGHQEERVRSEAAAMLNCFYDTHDWQLGETCDSMTPFEQVRVACVGEQLTVQLPALSPGKPFLFQLVALAMSSKPNERESLTSHVISHATPAIKFGELTRCGFYDWRVVQLDGDQFVPLILNGHPLKGRVIVQPSDARTLVVEEAFVDQIGASWGDTNDLCKRGSFRSSKGRVSELSKLGVNTFYLSGALSRDNGRVTRSVEDGEKTSERPHASPFAVTCRGSPCEFLGGAESFRDLADHAEYNKVRLVVDCVTRVSSTRRHRKYRDLVLYSIDDTGKKNLLYGSVGRGIREDESCQLNYRLAETWECLVEDVRKWPAIHGATGVKLEDAHLWPPILPVDHEELYRVDPDGEQHYDSKEILAGYIVRPDADIRQHGYWNTRARELGFANPLVVKLARAIWRDHPDFLLMAECNDLDGSSAGTLVRSGVVPQLTSLPVILGPVYGKHLTPDGAIVDHKGEPSNIEAFERWYNTIRASVPPGSAMAMSSCAPSSPLPALLYGSGAWCCSGLLLTQPYAPSLLYGEMAGRSYRIDAANFYEASTSTSSPGQAASAARRIASRSIAGRSGDSGDRHMAHAVTLSGRVELEKIGELESEHHRALREQQFDLNRIHEHYARLLAARTAYRVFTEGDYVQLHHEHHNKNILCFARVLPFAEVLDTPQDGRESKLVTVAVVVINFSKHRETVLVPLCSQPDAFDPIHRRLVGMGNELVLESNLLDPRATMSTDVPWAVDELVSSSIRIEVPSFGCEVRGFRACRRGLNPSQLAALYARSLERGGHFFVGALQKAVAADAPLGALRALLARLEQADVLDKLLVSMRGWPEHVRSTSLMSSLVHRIRALAEKDGAESPAARVMQSNELGCIVFVTPELGRFSTVGGLGVMVDELTMTLAAPEHGAQDVWVVSPYYERNRKGETGYLQREGIHWSFNVTVDAGGEHVTVGIYEKRINNVRLFFMHNGRYFPHPYPHFDPVMMMTFLVLMAKVPLEICCSLGQIPGTVVSNDWATGLTAAYAKHGFFGPTFNGTKFFHIVHNLDPSYEGRIFFDRVGELGSIHCLRQDLLVDPQWQRPCANPSRCALLTCDNWGTVSPSYRWELMNGSPLSPLLARYPEPFAFPNGIPLEARLKKINDLGLSGHAEAKTLIQQRYFHFEQGDPGIPLFAFVGRITSQKGVHLILDIAEQVIRRYGQRIQFLLGGMKNPGEAYSDRCCHRLWDLRRRFPHNFWADPDSFFTDGPLVNLGADFGIMPSAFEPGGIVQHEFFVAGTPVIAFKTGGLKDTVFEYNNSNPGGNGFTFEAHTGADLASAVGRALHIFSSEADYARLRTNARANVVTSDRVGDAWLAEFYRLHNKLHFPGNVVREVQVLALTAPLRDDPEADDVLGSVKEAGLRPADHEVRSSTTIEEASATGIGASPKGSTKNSGKAKSVQINWRPNGRPTTVVLAGSFDEWSSRLPFRYAKERQQWEAHVKLPPNIGKIFFKVIADGNWICIDGYRTERDAGGNENNVLDVETS